MKAQLEQMRRWAAVALAALSACAVDERKLSNVEAGAATTSEAGSRADAGGSEGSAGRAPDADSLADRTLHGDADASFTSGGSDGAVGTGATGESCLGGGDCSTGFCVDGVCCAGACDGKCMACAEAYTGAANGVCAPTAAGMDQHDSCAVSAPESCGNDGTCDGAGACRKFGSNQICSPASCSGSTFNPTRTCDGAGACATAATTDCGAFPCTTVGCAKPCTVDADCGTGNYCAAGQCKAKKSNGEACGTALECTSSFCVDSVCCQTACTGACSSCAEADTGQKSGSCQPISSGQDPGDECTTEPAAMCGRDGACDGKGACRQYGSATRCADALCSGTVFTPARTCSNGACAAAPTVDCKPTACTTAGCQSGCVKDTDCAAGAYCAGTSCAARKVNGDACTVGNECTSRSCVDGVCCETACAGICYACSSAKTGQASGKCGAVTAGTDLDNDCAATPTTTCGTEGTCDGAGACKRWAAGTECAVGMCNTAGNFVSARTCDGLGTCRAATTDTCAPSVCAATGCVRSCTSDTQCVGNNYCASGVCSGKKNAGAACTGNSQCLLGFCVDGVCCNNACNGLCVSCLAAQNGQPADGTCANIKAGIDPAAECAAGSTTCGPDGFCGGGKCRFAPATTACAGATCANATVTNAKNCDGNGACPTTGSSAPCSGNVVCASAAACKPQTCAADTDCISGFYCASGACKAKLAVGTSCAGGNQCQNGNCSSDGVCCSTTCGATCQACKVANTGVATGTCATRPGTTQCNGACGTGYMACGTGCVSKVWNFDQGPMGGTRPYGWYYSDIDNEFPSIQITYVAGVSHTPATNPGALGVQLPVGNGTGAVLVFAGAYCSAGVPLAGKTLTAYFSRSAQVSGIPQSVPADYGHCSFYLENSNGAFSTFVASTEIPINAALWTKMSGVVPESATGLFDKLQLSCTTPSVDPEWNGILYLDDISVSP